MKIFKNKKNISNVIPPVCDNTKFSAFYSETADELVNGLRNRFGDGPPEPEDLAQESFRRIFEHPEFPGLENKRAFLWRTALNLATSEHRKISVRNRNEPDLKAALFIDEGDISAHENVLCVREQLDAIQILLDGMPKRRRQIFMMRRIEDLTQAQIARALGISRSAVIKHLAKADQQLNELLLKDEE